MKTSSTTTHKILPMIWDQDNKGGRERGRGGGVGVGGSLNGAGMLK